MSAHRPQARARPPLDAPALQRLALRYVERFATTRGRLADYLKRKVRERGWAEETPPDVDAIAEQMAARGYVDDRAYGEAKAAAMTRRGLGARRVHLQLRHDGIDADTLGGIAPDDEAQALAAALAFARRKRIGPFAAKSADPIERRKHFAAMLRAGHAPALATAIVRLAPGADPDAIGFG